MSCSSTPKIVPNAYVSFNNEGEAFLEDQCQLEFSSDLTIRSINGSPVNWRSGAFFPKIYNISSGRHTLVFDLYHSYTSANTRYTSSGTDSITYNFLPGRIYWLTSDVDEKKNKLVSGISSTGYTDWYKPGEDETLLVFHRKKQIWIWGDASRICVNDDKYGIGSGETKKIAVKNGPLVIFAKSMHDNESERINIEATGGILVFDTKLTSPSRATIKLRN
jgi:hypothetical protein